jgi:hypothetical protein
VKRKSLIPFVAQGCERALLCQRLDENARRLAGILDAPFYVAHLEGLAALSWWKENCTVSFPKIWAKAKEKKGGGNE